MGCGERKRAGNRNPEGRPAGSRLSVRFAPATIRATGSDTCCRLMEVSLSAASSFPPSLTAEIRFWWPNGQTGVLSAWLEEKGIALSGPRKRTDLYIPTGSIAVNLKRREGEQLELKTKVQERPLVTAFTGQQQCEIWVKRQLPGLPICAGRQLGVRKTRWLACLDRQGERATDGHGASGCQLELSEVQPEGGQRTWTSFCLEAFGEVDLLVECLQGVIAKLGDLPCAHERPLVASYAEWLAREDYFDQE